MNKFRGSISNLVRAHLKIKTTKRAEGIDYG